MLEKPGKKEPDYSRRKFLEVLAKGLQVASLSMLTGMQLGILYKNETFQEFLESLDEKRKRNKEDFVLEIKKYFKDVYGVDFEIGFDRKKYSASGDIDQISDINIETIQKYCSSITHALSTYPKKMIKGIVDRGHPLTIILGNNLQIPGVEKPAAYVARRPVDTTAHILAVETNQNRNGNYYDPNYVVSIIHHEMNHFFVKTYAEQKGFIEEWNALLREAREKLDKEHLKFTFASDYGMTHYYEDMATFAQQFFGKTVPNYQYFPDWHSSLMEGTYGENDIEIPSVDLSTQIIEMESPVDIIESNKDDPFEIIHDIVQRKKNLLKKLYHQVSNGEMNEEYWKHLEEIGKVAP